MKTTELGLPFVLGAALFSSPLLLADEHKQGADGRVQELLKQLEADWATAVATNDANQIARFFADDFLFVGAGGILQDRKQHLEDFRSGRLKVDSVTIEDTTIHVYVGAAVVSSRVTVKGKFGDRDISGPYQFTDTWVKLGGHWLAAARQQTQARKPLPKNSSR